MRIQICKDSFIFSLWKEGDFCYSCYQHTELVIPELPAEGAKIPAGCTSSIQWADNRYPYLAFIPIQNVFRGELLRDLSTNAAAIELKSSWTASREWWQMDEGTKNAWLKLETCIVTACNHLYTKLPDSIRKKIHKPANPSYFGYTTTYDSVHKAVNSFNKSKRAFIVLLSYLSFIIAHLENPSDTEDDIPMWCTTLLKAKFQIGWIDKLRSTQVTDWSIPRMGSIIDLQTFDYSISTMHKMLKRNAQMVYRWNYNDEQYIDKILLQQVHAQQINNDDQAAVNAIELSIQVLKPQPEDITSAIFLEMDRTHRAAEHAEILNQFGNDVYYDPLSEQLPLEGIHAFLTRRAYEQVRAMDISTSQIIERCKALNERANKNPYPSLFRGTKVFVWRREPYYGTLIRQMVQPYAIKYEWTKNNHRSFNAYRNQWDIWRPEDEEGQHAVDATAHNNQAAPDLIAVQDAQMEDGPELIALQDEQMDNGMDIDELVEEEDREITQADMDINEDEYTQGIELLGELQTCTPPSFESMLADLFGFELQHAMIPLNYEVPGDLIREEDQKLPKLIVNEERTMEGGLAARLRHFFTFMEKQMIPPRMLWDVTGRSIEEFGNMRVVVGRPRYTTYSVKRSTNKWLPEVGVLVDNKTLTLHEITLNDYENDDELRVFVRQSSVATLLQRINIQYVRNLTEVVAYMLGKGIFFILAVEHLDEDISRKEYILPPIPCHPNGYVASAVDYHSYIEQRNNHFTQNWKRCVKMLRMGGIMWRIAMDHIHGNLGAIFCANTEDEHVIDSIDPNDPTLYTEGISMEECNFICGRIRTVSTGKYMIFN